MKLESLDIKMDRRGSLVEAYKLPNDGQVFYVIAEPGETRGNHYHKRKIEHFLVIHGSAVIQVRNRITNDVMNVEVSGGKPMRVSIYPNHTHNISSKEGCIFLVWCDEQFDESDPDTFAEEI
jgi:UDP-2-acetamido-2,6-beta-L-arabino-hexul-4-ose reductase